jgi:hypothetical protein
MKKALIEAGGLADTKKFLAAVTDLVEAHGFGAVESVAKDLASSGNINEVKAGYRAALALESMRPKPTAITRESAILDCLYRQPKTTMGALKIMVDKLTGKDITSGQLATHVRRLTQWLSASRSLDVKGDNITFDPATLAKWTASMVPTGKGK